MSGKPRHEDPAGMVPVRFHKAFRAGELSVRQYALGLYLAEESFIARPASGGIVTVRLALLAVEFEVSEDTIGRDLRGMEAAGCIECEVSAGSRDGWRIWLTGLASPAQPPHDLRTTSAKDPAAVRRWTSAGTSAATSASSDARFGANAHGESASAPLEPPHEPPHEPPQPRVRAREPEPEPEPKSNPGFEENKREVLGPVRRDGEEISRLGPSLAELMEQARLAAEAKEPGKS